MPSATLTQQQANALATRDTSVALAAGAGCGKTFVLTERFLSHLEPGGENAPQPAEIRQLIAITFTDAAAREMRSRIRAKCYERLQATDTRERQDYWLRLMRAIETARVSTIHAFCASLLRVHALEAELDPAFGVLEQGEADVLVSEVIDDVLRDRLAERDDDTLNLAASLGLPSMKTQLRELLKYRHEPHFQQWQHKPVDELVAAWHNCHQREAFPAAVRELADGDAFAQVVRLLESIEPPAGNDTFLHAACELLELLKQLTNERPTNPPLSTIHKLARVQSVCKAKDWPTKDLYDDYASACKELRNEIEKCQKLQFDPAAAREAAELGLAILRLAGGVADAYETAKDRLGKLDFDDLLARAYQLVSEPRHAALREELAGDLRLLLVDEFQDTDRLQVDLVKAICGEELNGGKLFFVGDDKQSIYRFRGAEPKVFQDLRAAVPCPGRLPLTVNFRSQPAILNFVNALFGATFGKDYQPLRPHRTQVSPQPAVEFFWPITPDKRNRWIKGAARAARDQEARWIARRLRGLIDGGEKIIAESAAGGGTRALQLGDVAILFRALSDVDIYEAALREYGLDYYLVGGHAFYAQQEIYDVLNLLRAIASPADEISLAGVLRSPLFSLHDETLFWLVESAESLSDGLFSERLPAELSPEERDKTAAAATTLLLLRERKDLVPIATLLEEALARTGYDAALLAEFLGERKLANLHKLLEQARSADVGGSLDLPGFIAQLAEFVAREPKEALAATMSESADVIRLMTIHHAKGLEFPLVVVPDLDRPQEFRGPAAALDPVLGPLVSLPKDDDDHPATTGMDLYRSLEKRADAEERKRLLYVACTRAADYLILSSSLAAYDELESDWMKLVARQFDLAMGAAHGELPPDFAVPQVRVTNEEPPTDHRPAGRSRGTDLLKLLATVREEAAAGAGHVPPEVRPIPVDAAARRQFSVSRISGQFVRADATQSANAQEQLPRPADAVDPRGLGTLVHAVLQRVSLQRESGIAALCEQLAAELVVENADFAAKLAEEMIDRFVTSPRWSQIAAAAIAHRELEFLLAWPPDQVASDGDFLQGYMDCLYQDAAGWHLIDYKTNNLAAAECSRIATQYEMQMVVYALAVEQSLGQAPLELVVHFLRPDVEHVFPWNDAARRRGIELVNQAIEGLRVQG